MFRHFLKNKSLLKSHRGPLSEETECCARLNERSAVNTVKAECCDRMLPSHFFRSSLHHDVGLFLFQSSCFFSSLTTYIFFLFSILSFVVHAFAHAVATLSPLDFSTAYSCDTFLNPPLCTSEQFEISQVEVGQAKLLKYRLLIYFYPVK